MKIAYRFFIVFLLLPFLSQSQIVLNEVSQGPNTGSGAKEYVEFVVVGDGSCSQATVDLRGWIFDDNNGWLATGTGRGIAAGAMRFSNNANWQNVPRGSIIVIYNNEDKNPAITQANDPTDANNDKVYILPANSNLFERHVTQPSSPGNANFSYPTTNWVSNGEWSTISLANGGDGVIITSPTVRNQAFFSFSYGLSSTNGTVNVPSMASDKCYYLSDGNYTSVASWLEGDVATSQTPGAPNSPANQAWIESLRSNSGSGVNSYQTECIKQGESFSFHGQTLTTTGNYTHTIPGGSMAGCDSTVNLYLVVANQQSFNFAGCGSYLFNGTIYTSSTVILDTIKSIITSCDSIYITNTITINQPVTNSINICLATGNTYNFNGSVLNTTGAYTHTLTGGAANGCDSTVNLYLVVASTEVNDITACGSYTFNGVTYTSNTTVIDTIASLINGCDSVIRTNNIVINQVVNGYTTGCIKQGDSFSFHGQSLTTGGNYTHTIPNGAFNGCDSVVNLYLVVTREEPTTVSGCESVSYGGISYTTNTVLRDTILSLVTGCDSVINIVNIEVFANPLVTATASQQTICVGESVQLNAVSAGSTFVWNPGGVGNQINVSPTNTTTYTATATNANGCQATATVTITVNRFDLTLQASVNPILIGGSTQLLTSSSDPYTITSWSPSSLFTNQTALAQTIQPTSTVAVEVIGEGANGCIDTASVQLIVQGSNTDLFVPNVFTPNNDGKNDVLMVYGTTVSQIDFHIFNQWGELLFRTQDKSKGWDGTYKNKQQPVGVYIYVLKATMLDGTIQEKKGSINLIR